MNQQPTQAKMYYAAEKQSAELNDQFLWLVKNGMTRKDLGRCIELRPDLWSRFSNWMEVLP